jgi:hypothetical protein
VNRTIIVGFSHKYLAVIFSGTLPIGFDEAFWMGKLVTSAL